MPKSKHRRKTKRGSAAEAPAAATGQQLSSTAAETSRGEGTTPKAKKVGPVQFFRQVRDEGRKVTWTSRNEATVSTIMVLIMVTIASLFFLLVDEVLLRIVPFILNLNG